MIDWLAEPFALGFMQRALAASIIVGVVCAVIGCYIVLRSLAFLGDALAHAVLPGVAVAYLVGANVLAGALVAGLLVAVGISFVSRSGTIKEDTAIGIFFAAALALGVVLISTMDTYAVDLTHILFGNVLGVTATDLVISGGLAALVLAAIGLLYKQLLVVSFDPILGRTLGLHTHGLRTMLFLMLAATIVVSLRTVGVALVAAMLVTPPAGAYLLTRRLPSMMAVSAVIGVVSAIGGLYVSYYLDVASGGAMVLVATLIFVVVFLVAPHKGVVWRLRTRFQMEPRAPGGEPAA
ncbi:MAG: metal ABC transporter permease, partial [Actinomycetia bacterium]|nr:metal ABC transporter permease [Actinomycetes bacterium]